MNIGLYKVSIENKKHWVIVRSDGIFNLPISLNGILELSLDEARKIIDGKLEPIDISAAKFLPPIDDQEVWACGVTYLRSREGRAEESGSAALYTAVYDASRPEIFFKSTADRVVGSGEAVGIRKDSGWDVPEAEVGLVVNSSMEIIGYVAGNDMSSRSIEGENPLYLPQAKCYDRSCSLGHAIVPKWMLESEVFDVSVKISRNGDSVFTGETSTAQMRRTFPELVDWLGRAMSYPVGAIVLTGTGIVPDRGFTLMGGDVIDINIAGLGTLSNPVIVVGR